MSRGLGNSQRAFLAALVSLEASHGAGRHFHLWAVLAQMAESGMQTRLDAAAAREAAEIAKYRGDRLRRRAEVEVAAKAGDANAKQEFDRLGILELLAGVIRRKKSSRGRFATRPSALVEQAINPSRLATSLRQRALIDYRQGACSLTDLGRAAAPIA